MLTTAAGTVKPATLLLLGVGVAGCRRWRRQAPACQRPLGMDVRPEVADQVRSVGAQWLIWGSTPAGEGGYARS